MQPVRAAISPANPIKRESEYSLPFLLLLFFAFGIASLAALSIAGARECFVERRNAAPGITFYVPSRGLLFVQAALTLGC